MIPLLYYHNPSIDVAIIVVIVAIFAVWYIGTRPTKTSGITLCNAADCSLKNDCCYHIIHHPSTNLDKKNKFRRSRYNDYCKNYYPLNRVSK